MSPSAAVTARARLFTENCWSGVSSNGAENCAPRQPICHGPHRASDGWARVAELVCGATAERTEDGRASMVS